jgi:diguanylate cyclase (GGDEF)-like protein
MSRTGPIRGYFAHREDPYAGGDLENAQRLGTVLWGLLVVLAVLLVPLNPPTDVVGSIGWLLAALLILAGIAATFYMRAGRFSNWTSVLAVSYATIIAIGVMQWLSGGQSAPFRGLVLLPVLFVAAAQPPRRIAPYMVVVFLVLAAPFVYDTWDTQRAEGTAATFVIWCAIAGGASLLMAGVRAQRLSLQEEGQEARAEARIDSLTGLRNRRAFDELLGTEISRARQLGLPLSMAMVDIANFKEVNERWSYAEGDRCLTEVAQTLKSNLRQPDFCFRWGGDEFALILSGTPADETGPIADRLIGEVSRICKRPDDSPIRLRFAAVELSDEMSSGELTEGAGLALTAAKLDDDQRTNATSSS